MHSDMNDDKQIIRIRFKDINDATINEDQEDEKDGDTAVQFIKSVEESLCNDLTLKGYPEI